MNPLNLNALYRDATRGLPQDADRRLTVDELVSLGHGKSLGARHDAAIAGLASSSDQALAARLSMATADWSQALASDLADLRRPRLAARLGQWFKAATLPPVFAACAISLLAVAAWRVGEPAVGPIIAPTPQLAADDVLFSGEFDGSVAQHSDPDQLFGGDFDS